MENLYNLNSNSNHVRFFRWMWGVEPSIRYKTMCPYFWQYLGSIIILPFIILVKLAMLVLDPIDDWIQELAERDTKLYVARLMEQYEMAKTEKDYYNIFNSKCWKKYRYKWNKIIDEAFFTGDMIIRIRTQAEWYENKLEKAKQKRKQNLQKQLDNFKYGKAGTFLSYLIGAAVVFLVGWGIYTLLHLFTWGEFVNFCKYVSIGVIAIAILVGIIYIIGIGLKTLACDTKLANVVFWKPIGNAIVCFFKGIWTGIVMTFDMIKNIYKKNCPIIYWNRG